MTLKIYISGTLYDKEDAKISVYDHGLLYGDGVFEGMRVYGGKVFRLPEHLERLWNSAKAIWLEIPVTPEALAQAVNETVAVNGIKDGYVRLVITRGAGTLGLDPNHCRSPEIIIIADTITLYPREYYEKGLHIVTVSTMRNHPAALSPRIKSLNYLNNILARIEAGNAGAGEGLMLNEQGYVAECTGDNIFVLKNGELFTPPASAGALKGITRQVVFEIAAEFGIRLQEANLTRYDVYTADECFLTGTAAEIIALVKLDSRPIGSGVPGPLTARLIARFRELTQSTGTPIYAE